MPALDFPNLGNGFRKHFRIDAAVDEALRDEVFHIRHQVYCEELKFEPERPDRRETDMYDAHSLHCLLRAAHAPHTPIGCARLVTVDPARPAAPLPFERLCAATLDRTILDPARLPRGGIAEISRLAVRHRYRRCRSDDRSTVAVDDDEDFGAELRPRFPYVPIALYMGAVALAAHRRIDTLFVLTEPRLAKCIARLGVDIRQIGAPVWHRGLRVPSVMNVQRIIRGMNLVMKPLWRAVSQEVEAGLQQATDASATVARIHETPPVGDGVPARYAAYPSTAT